MAARTRERTGRVRMAEVAARAGVSAVTVSRVLHAPSTVAEATRGRVTAAIAELGYLPNLIARSLAATRTGVMAALIPTIDHSLHAEVVQAMSEVMRAAGFHLLLGSTDFSLEHEEELVRAFLARQADALFLTGTTHTEATRRLLQSARVPVVEIAQRHRGADRHGRRLFEPPRGRRDGPSPAGPRLPADRLSLLDHRRQ